MGVTDMPSVSHIIKNEAFRTKGGRMLAEQRAKVGVVCVGCWSCPIHFSIFFFFSAFAGLWSSSDNPEPQENCSRDTCSFWKDRLCLHSLNQPLSTDSDLDSCPSPTYAFHPFCSTPNVCPIGTSHLICVKYKFLSFLSFPPSPDIQFYSLMHSTFFPLLFIPITTTIILSQD